MTIALLHFPDASLVHSKGLTVPAPSGFLPPGGVTLEPLPTLEVGAALGLETVLALGVLTAGVVAPGRVTLEALPGKVFVGVLEVGAVTFEAVIVVLL
jgi:hypothetical protein